MLDYPAGKEFHILKGEYAVYQDAVHKIKQQAYSEYVNCYYDSPIYRLHL